MRLHLAKHLLPALNQTGHFTVAADTKPAAKEVEGSPNKKRRRSSKAAGSFSSASSVAAKDLKKVYKHMTATINLQLVLMDRLESLVQSLPLDNQQLLLITSGALPALEIDCIPAAVVSNDEPLAQQLQTASIAVLTAAFRKYPMHRGIILEDLFPVMLHLPTGKRSLRVFPVRYSSSPSSCLEAFNTTLVGPMLSNGGQPHLIQMMTALVLSLVHACVVRPTYDVEHKNKGKKGEREQQMTGKLQSGLRASQAVADSFVAQLLKLCTKSKNGSASEYRPILANIVEDLLLVCMIPEYPAAELLLSALQQRLSHDLTLASVMFGTKNGQQPQAEATYLNSAFDVMGKICAFQARILAAARDKPIHARTDVPMSNTSRSEQDVECHCKSGRTDVLLIQCDRCNALMHGPCVGLPDKESLPDEWFCDPCCLGKIICREQGSLSDDEASYIDQYYAMHHSFQAMMAHRLGVDMEDAVQFHLARWVDELERNRLSDDTKRHSRKIVAKLLDYWDVPGPAAEPLTDEGVIRVILRLMANTSPFFLAFREQIRVFLKIMSDESAHALRKLSLKAIEKVRNS
jgi:cohesin loading factor subunit SCC2